MDAFNTDLEMARRHVAEGLLEPADHAAGRAVLTLRGRLLADPVTVDRVVSAVRSFFGRRD